MDKKKPEMPTEYQIGNIKYTVKPVYGEASQKEGLEDKIRRLILSDKESETPRA